MTYDVTNRRSFLNVPDWLEEIKKYAGKSVCMVLIGNKSDSEEREVSTAEGTEFAS